MACYTADLVSGENILSMTLKSGTISRYLSAAADISISANMMNPCLDTTGNQSRYIKDILHEAKRWELIPNRQDPLTKPMVFYIIKKGKSLHKTNPHNLYSALGDWLTLGLQSGFRRKEWAQAQSHLRKTKDVQRNIDGSPAAFVLDDFEFRGKNNQRLNQASIKDINRAHSVNVKWRYQKNNDNGQVITYIKDSNTPDL